MATSSRTAKYINELQPSAKKHLDQLKNAADKMRADINTANECVFVQQALRLARAEIRGYLTALNDAGIISDVGFRCLYIYYTNFI